MVTGPSGIFLPRLCELPQLVDINGAVTVMCFTWNIASRVLIKFNAFFYYCIFYLLYFLGHTRIASFKRDFRKNPPIRSTGFNCGSITRATNFNIVII